MPAVRAKGLLLGPAADSIHCRHQKEEMLNSQGVWVSPEPLATLFSAQQMLISVSQKLYPLYPKPPTTYPPQTNVYYGYGLLNKNCLGFQEGTFHLLMI